MTKLDPEQRATLDIVCESGKSVLRITDDILDYSRMEAGKLELHRESTSLCEVIENVVNLYSSAARTKGLELRCSVDPKISPALLVDSLRLRQILNNLVSNAVKFTVAGHIEISAKLLERQDGRDRVRFSVQDTGIGVSDENQMHLFQPFSQGNAVIGRQFGGTGLGLAVCRHLAQLLEGSVEMESELGKGTKVVLTLLLPIAQPTDLRGGMPEHEVDPSHESAQRRSSPNVSDAEAEGTLVLLVDDHPINRMLLLRQVNTLGYAAVTADHGSHALERLSLHRFGLVITDCNMPVMDGYELARSIRRMEDASTGKRVPIVACTANALHGEPEKCTAAGMDDFLTKPIGLQVLQRKLAQWLPLPHQDADFLKVAATRSEMLPHHAPAPKPDLIDFSVLAESCGVSEGPGLAAVFEVWNEANEDDTRLLRQAVEDEDLSQIRIAAHRMLGACKMIGAQALARVLEQLERASESGDLAAIELLMKSFDAESQQLHAYLEKRASCGWT